MRTKITLNCNPKDCHIENGLCLTHGYSVNGTTIKCENYPEPAHFHPKFARAKPLEDGSYSATEIHQKYLRLIEKV